MQHGWDSGSTVAIGRLPVLGFAGDGCYRQVSFLWVTGRRLRSRVHFFTNPKRNIDWWERTKMNGPSPVLIGPQLTKLVGLTKVTSQVIQRPWFRLLHNSKSFFSRWTRVIWTKQRRNSRCWDRDESIAPAIDLFPNSTSEDGRTLGYSTAFVLRGLRRLSFFGHFVPIERASRSNLINQRRNSRSFYRDEPIAPFFFWPKYGRRSTVDSDWVGRPKYGRPTFALDRLAEKFSQILIFFWESSENFDVSENSVT